MNAQKRREVIFLEPKLTHAQVVVAIAGCAAF
jgi:hypothetical protein